MRTFPRALSGAASSVLIAAVLITVPTAAHASVRNAPCTEHGKQVVEFTNRVFVWDVAQRTREENYSGHPASISFEITTSTSRTNSVSSSVTGSFSADAIFASFEASVKAEMGSANSVTALTKTTRSYTLDSGDNYVFGQGTGRWTGTATTYQCQQINRDKEFAYRQTAVGPVTGYTGRTNSVVACKKTPPAGTFAERLKALGC